MFEEIDIMIDKIRSVGLNAAYVSIEENKREDLEDYLKSKGITYKPAHWNHPEGIYIGSSKEPKDLVVLSLEF